MSPRHVSLIVAALLLRAAPARAERPHEALTLTYLPIPAAASLCPEADFLAMELRHRFGYELIQKSAPEHLTVKLDRPGGRFRSHGEIRDDAGNVTFDQTYSGIDCTETVVGMATLVSIKYWKPAEAKSPPAPEPEPTAPPPAVCPPSPKPVSPEKHESPALSLVDRPNAQMGFASVFSIGVAPVVVGGASAFLGMRWMTSSLALEMSALFAPSATVKNYSIATGYNYRAASIAGSGCYYWPWAFGCLRADFGILSIGNTTINVTPERIISFGVGLRFGKDWLLTPRIALRAYSEFTLRPMEGTLRGKIGNVTLWPGSILSASIGFGPVFSFSKL